MTVLHAAPVDARSAWAPWLALSVGLLALYAPTVLDLYHQFWQFDLNSHGPIVIALAAWLLVHQGRQALADPTLVVRPAPTAGALLWLPGLLCYVIGRSQALLVLEMGSAVPLFAGVSVALFGGAFTRRLWFGFAFIAFTIPLPGSVTDAITQPLKIGVSWASEWLLHAANYPIARSGVILYVGQFQLLVADACAGLNSLFTLEALGLLYLNTVRHASVMRNVTLAILIVPISFSANTLRVVTLALITFHFGDEAGQGFLHGFSGMVLFLSALLLIIAVDAGLRRLSLYLDRSRQGPQPNASAPVRGAP